MTNHNTAHSSRVWLLDRANAREAVCFLASTICTQTFQIVYNSTLLNGKTFDEVVQHTFLHFQVTVTLVPVPLLGRLSSRGSRNST